MKTPGKKGFDYEDWVIRYLDPYVKPTPASGSKQIKCDAESEQFMIEIKHTDKLQYILKRELIATVEHQALMKSKYAKRGAIALGIADKNYVLINIDDFKELLEHHDKLK